MMLDKKQIQAIFLLEFKMGHKSAEAACNINNTFGPGSASEHTVQWWFRKFCKGNKRLEMRSSVASHQTLTMASHQTLTMAN